MNTSSEGSFTKYEYRPDWGGDPDLSSNVRESLAGRPERNEPVLSRLLSSKRGDDLGATDELEAVLTNAKRLADSVIANVDDWAEGRAYAHALRESLRKYQESNT